jgi:hypothetical protein
MPTAAPVDQLTKAQEWALEQMKANQERVLDLNKKVASLVEKLPAVKVPFADRLPDQKDMVSKYFDFVTKSTEANREFATAIADVWSGKDGAEAPKPATKPATKARSAAKAR